MPCGRRHVQRRIPPYFCVIAASWSVGLFDGEAGPSGGATASSAASAGHSLAHSAEPVTASGVFTSVAAPPVVNLEHDLHTECTCTRHASAALSGAPLGRQQRRLPAFGPAFILFPPSEADSEIAESFDAVAVAVDVVAAAGGRLG